MLSHTNVSVGADVSWNSYYEYTPKTTYQLKDGAVTTDLYKYVYTLPLALTAHYYFPAGKIIHPYLGVGLGATYADEQLYYNTYVTEDTQWGFLVRPELGALIKVNPKSGWGILAGVRYSYSTNKQTEFKIDNLSSIGVQLGVAWGLY
jgi:outer membrane protein W